LLVVTTSACGLLPNATERTDAPFKLTVWVVCATKSIMANGKGDGGGVHDVGGGVVSTYWPTTRYRPSGERAKVGNAKQVKSKGKGCSWMGDCNERLPMEITSMRFAVKLAA
jgi:hypothetical protein